MRDANAVRLFFSLPMFDFKIHAADAAILPRQCSGEISINISDNIALCYHMHSEGSRRGDSARILISLPAKDSGTRFRHGHEKNR